MLHFSKSGSKIYSINKQGTVTCQTATTISIKTELATHPALLACTNTASSDGLMHHSTSHCRPLWVCVYFRQWLLGSHMGLCVNHTAADVLGEINIGQTKILLILKEGKET